MYRNEQTRIFQHTSISAINSPFSDQVCFLQSAGLLQFTVTVDLETFSKSESTASLDYTKVRVYIVLTDNGGGWFYDFSADDTAPPAATCCGWLSSGRPVCRLFG